LPWCEILLGLQYSPIEGKSHVRARTQIQTKAKNNEVISYWTVGKTATISVSNFINMMIFRHKVTHKVRKGKAKMHSLSFRKTKGEPLRCPRLDDEN